MTKDEVAQIVHGMPEGMHIDDYLVELVNRAVAVEREACAEVCLEGTDMPVQVDALKIIRAERERIANAIRARGEK